MQFFPAHMFKSVSAMGGVSLAKASSAAPIPNDFLSFFNKELASSGVRPVVDPSVKTGPPVGFRTIKQDVSSKLDSDDVNFMLEKLRQRGVDNSVLTGIESLVSSGANLTIGNIMGSLRKGGRSTELNEDDLRNISSALQKMQFSTEESEEIVSLMEAGHGAQALKHIRASAKKLGGAEALSLTGEETQAIMRGLDLSENTMIKFTALLTSEMPRDEKKEIPASKMPKTAEEAVMDGKNSGKIPAPEMREVAEAPEVDGKTLEKLLAPAIEEFALKQSEEKKLAAEMKSVIDETLSEKKNRKRNEPVADTRGSQLTERAERLMRDDLTAKANGFDKTPEERKEETAQAIEEQLEEQIKERSYNEGLKTPTREAGDDRKGLKNPAEDNSKTVSVLNEERKGKADLADGKQSREQAEEHADGEQPKQPVKENKTVSALDSGRDVTSPEAAPSKAKEAFSQVVNRVDAASGMTVPVQNQTVAAPQTQNTAAFTQRQEVFSQVENGLLRQLADGSRQMTLRLDPAELGQVTLVLSVKNGEIRAMIRAENPETTAALSDQMNNLRATLEEQGFKVAQLDVETRLPQDTTKEQWSGMEQFHQEQEMREQERFLRLSKLRRESGESLARDMQNNGIQEEISASGLHIIA